jgi:hypothetical protein
LTDPTGPCFLSYKRERVTEAALLVQALRDHGIPTWQDVSDLPIAITETALETVLAEPTTSSAVLLVTPEVAASHVIRNVEAPAIFARAARGDGFFAVPVAAGGIDYTEVSVLLGPKLGLTDVSGYNILKAPNDPIDPTFAASVALRALRERILACVRASVDDAPLTLQVWTRGSLPKTPGFTLRADLTHHFAGRHAAIGAWDDHILPAFAAISAEFARSAPGRRVQVSGFLSLPSAVALGAAFSTVSPIRASWMQEQTKFGDSEIWTVAGPDAPCGFDVDVRPRSAGGTDLALLVSATNDVVQDFTLSSSGLPLRAVIHLSSPQLQAGRQHLGSGEARSLACVAVDAIRDAVNRYGTRGAVHLFLAVPAGVAFMIGQQLNTLGVVQTYEHNPLASLPYMPSATLRPSG